MRRNSCTVIVLGSPVPPEVLGAVGRSMNVTLVHPADQDGSAGGPAAAADALRRAASATSPYALVTADPLAAVAEGWQGMWDLTHPQGPARFEQEASGALAAWRSGQFELPDYYLVTAAEADDPMQTNPVQTRTVQTSTVLPGPPEQNFYLGPLRAARPRRVAFVPATEPAEQAAGVLQALGSLRHGPWWPALDDLIAAARTFYPGSLAEATLSSPDG
jgi:hypothetical protein